MPARSALTAFIVLSIVCGLGGYLARVHFAKVPATTVAGCRAESANRHVDLDVEQMGHAATISAVGMRGQLPDRAVVVALATALQESKLRNLDHLGSKNDHDSLGLFQQRPSQGWGTPSQVRDPRYAAGQFYDALIRVDGWEQLRITEAAQRVQRSAHPEAYQKWADEARILAEALMGRAPASVTCQADEPRLAGREAAAATVDQLRRDFGPKAPQVELDDLRLRLPVSNSQAGWQLAHWLVTRAYDTGVSRVTFGALEWTAQDLVWRDTGGTGPEVVAEIRPA